MDLSRSVGVVCAAPWTVRTSEPEIRIRVASRVRLVIPSLHKNIRIQFEDSLHGFGQDGERNV
jgi:hypothetical protein